MKILLTLAVLFWSGFILAQQPGGGQGGGMPKIGKIYGIVYDSTSKEALEFATVSVYSVRDSSLVGGIITDEKGKFEITELPVGMLKVVVSYMGYGSYTVDKLRMKPDNASIDLGKIYIAPTQATLATAEVTADKVVFQLGLDKKVFNVDKTNLGESENATAILRSTPTVEVDFDGNVKIRGAAVQVYINGKPTGLTGESQAEILDQLPANTVKSVELITNPSAKFDPEGGSGIINIVLKKNVLEGFTGSANVSLGTSTWVPFRRGGAGLSLNFKNNKINIFSNFSYDYNERYGRNYNLRSTFLTTDTSFLEQFSNSKRVRNGGMARIGMDYYFDDYNTLTIAGRFNGNMGSNSGSIQYDYLDAERVKTDISKRINDGIENRYNMTYNLIYAKVFKQKKKETKEGDDAAPRRDNSEDKFQSGHGPKHWGKHDQAAASSGTMGDKQELVIDLQYSMSNNAELESFSQQLYHPDWSEANNTPDSQYTTTYHKMHQGTLSIDYTHPFSENIKFETGYKGNIRWLGNDFASKSYNYTQMNMVNDTGLTNNFEFLEQVHALYVTFAHKIGKFQYKVGFRGEFTSANSMLVYPTASSFVNNYPSFFPTIHLSYELPKNQQIQLGFSRRIQRPSTWALNPFANYTDPLNLRYGNPKLMPQYTNSTELTYVNYWGKGNTFMLTAFYRYNTDLIEQLRTVDSVGVVSQTHYNFSKSHVWGGELTTRFAFFDWWDLSLSGSVYQSLQDGTNVNPEFSVNAVSGNVNLGTNFSFKFGMRISLNASYSFPTLVAQGWSSGYLWNSLSISQKVLKNKGTITLNVQNPILGNEFSYETSAYNFKQYGKRQWEGPVFELKFSYRFGKVNVRDGQSKNAGRLGSGGDGGGREE